ncbi:hypothetical protein [Streptomyces netropsis]|uniref:Uncharacterized protein n=1 Tax=Streptomyces netropsis TaxID=55404 RepID=A0A7W7LFG7_STRNE|nr:hypothetical protein [Streptomyces netropsis]MBB4889164.1 hypothetical protein [Streptomyces netropsis]
MAIQIRAPVEKVISTPEGHSSFSCHGWASVMSDAWSRTSKSNALTTATLLNSAFSGLQGDYLITGDKERTETALDELCAWIDSRVQAARSTNRTPAAPD